MLNFGGLGFEFEATDDGAEKIADNISDSVTKLWTNLKSGVPIVGKAGRAMSTGFAKMRGIGSRAMGGLALATASAIEQATDPKLSSSIDQMMAGFGKSFKAMTVGMNMTSKEAKKMQGVIGSAAYSLNEDMDGAARSWAAFRKQSVDLNKVLGSKGTAGAIKDLIKVTAVYEVEGEQLSNVISGHIKGFGFTEERVGALADKMVFLGKQYDIGREAIQAWPAIFESLNQELADFGRNATPEDIEQLTTSIIGLGAGLKESLGISGQEGIEMARNVFTTIMGERKNILQMARAMGGEIGDFGMQLAEAGGNVQDMFAMIQADPLRFMSSLRELAKRAESHGGTMGVAFQRLSGQINESLGPGVTFAMRGNWDKFQESLSKIPGYLASPEARGAFTKFAKHAHSTGRTMQDQWELTLENMRHRLMNISKPLKKEWVKTMTGGFKTTIDAIEELAKEDGPAGRLTKRLLLVKDVGLSGLIPELGKLAPLFGGALSSLVPFMTAFGAMGLSFAKVGKMGLAGGGIYVLFKILKEGPEEAWRQFKELGDSLLKLADTVFPGVREQVLSLFGDIEKVGVGEFVGKMFRNLGKKLGEYLRSVDWVKVGKTIASFLMEAFIVVGETIGGFFSGLFSADEVEKEAKQPLTAGFQGAITSALFSVLQGSAGIIKGAFKKFWEYMFSAESVGDLGSRIAKVATGVVLPVFALAMFKGFKTAALGTGFITGFKGVFGVFGKILKVFGPAFIAIRFFIELLSQVKTKMEDITTVMESELVPEAQKTAVAGELAFEGMLSAIDSALFGLPSMIGKHFGLGKREVIVFYHGVVELFQKAMNAIHYALELTSHIFVTYFEMWPKVVDRVLDIIVASWDLAFTWMQGKVEKVFLRVEGWLDGIVFTFKRIWMDIRHVIEDVMEGTMSWVADKILSLNDLAPMLVPDAMVDAAKKIRKEFEATGGEVGREKRQSKETRDLVDAEIAAAESRRLRFESIDAETDRATALLGKNVDLLWKTSSDWDERLRQGEKWARSDYEERGRNIERASIEAIEASLEADAEIRKKREGRDKEEEKEEKKKKRRRGKARPPTTQERAAMELAVPTMLGAPQAAGPALQVSTELAQTLKDLKTKGIPVNLKLESDRKLKGFIKITEGTGSSGSVPVL